MSEERTPGRVSTACMVSSRRQTHSWTSWRGRLQSSAKRATLPGTSSRVVDSGHGRGSAYWPKARRARWPAAEPNCMPRKTGPSVRANCPRSPPSPAGALGVELAQVHGRRDGRRALLLRLHHRAGGRAGRPRARGTTTVRGRPPRRRRRTARGRRDPGGVGHVELGHPGQLLERDAHERVGVVVLAAVGGDAVGEGAGRLEPAVAAPGADPMTFIRSPRRPPIGLSGSPEPNMLTLAC